MSELNGQGREQPDDLPEDGPLGQADLLEPRRPAQELDDPDDEDAADESEDLAPGKPPPLWSS